MHIEDILKVKLNKQHNTTTSWLVTTIKEILKTPIQKLDKTIFLFKRTNKTAASNIKILAALNGSLGKAYVVKM